ncbi:MAG: type II toxin-antitoxin system RelE/ParE family toxin [Terriglobales bacterium]
MAGKRLDIHPAALAELKSAVKWYLERSEPAAQEFVAEVDRAIDLVMDSPKRWPAGEYATRRFILQRFPFAVTYREKESGVQILAFAHGHRRPGYWKERL